MKELILLRGLPGAGKSTLAKTLGGVHYETYMYFTRNGDYKFDFSWLKRAHEWCQESVLKAMDKSEPLIVVSNTFTREWEMKAYYELAEKYGYQIHSLIVENRHGGVNEHGVSKDTVKKMKERFQINI